MSRYSSKFPSKTQTDYALQTCLGLGDCEICHANLAWLWTLHCVAAKSSSCLSCKSAVSHAEYATQNHEKNLLCRAAHRSVLTIPFLASQVCRPRHICNWYRPDLVLSLPGHDILCKSIVLVLQSCITNFWPKVNLHHKLYLSCLGNLWCIYTSTILLQFIHDYPQLYKKKKCVSKCSRTAWQIFFGMTEKQACQIKLHS